LLSPIKTAVSEENEENKNDDSPMRLYENIRN
jgi:hypothetical protein